jgi:hypothetical protein
MHEKVDYIWRVIFEVGPVAVFGSLGTGIGTAFGKPARGLAMGIAVGVVAGCGVWWIASVVFFM